VDGELTDLPQLVGKPHPGLILINDEDLGYAKIRLDSASLACAKANLSGFESAMARSLVWGTVWDAARDAEISVHEYIDLVLDHIASETESTTLLVQLRQLATATRLYVPNAERNATREKVSAGLLRLLREAKPKSDAQLQFAKVFAQLASGEKQLQALSDIHAGKEQIDGLAIDTDLAWELLVGLVAGGKAGEPEIAAALAKDNTANGQKAAAAARAAVAADKAATWHKLTATNEYSNALVESASAAFGRGTDVSFLELFAEKYRAEAKMIWQTKTFKIAEYLLENLFPIQLASQKLYDDTKAWLESEDWSELASMKRILVENLAMLERALKVQAASKS
jgi:aminopeptidase N